MQNSECNNTNIKLESEPDGEPILRQQEYN